MTEKFILNLCRTTHEKLSISFEISISKCWQVFRTAMFSCLFLFIFYEMCDVESEREETSYVVLSCLLREEEYLFIEMEMFRSEKKRFLLIKLNSAKSQ